MRPARLVAPLLLSSLLAVAAGGCAAETDLAPAGGTPGGGGKADDVTSDPEPAPAPEGCVFDPSDPFESHERVPRGKYRGRCYDTRLKRSVVVLADERADSYGGLGDGDLVVANVYHDDQFWVARIPLDGVEAVLFQLELFPAVVPAAHSQMRLRFREDSPVVLLGQAGGNAGEEAETRDLLFTIEATGVVGFKYDLLRGLVNDFGSSYRVISLESKIGVMIIEKGHRVVQWELLLEPEETQRFVENYVYDSDAHQLQTMYNTLWVNCTNELIRILDDSVDYSAFENIRRFLVKITEIYPVVVRRALIARGLLPRNHSSDWPDLAEDPTVSALLDRLRGGGGNDEPTIWR